MYMIVGASILQESSQQDCSHQGPEGRIYTMVMGHYVACACDVLGIPSIDEPPVLPLRIHGVTNAQKLAFTHFYMFQNF